MAVRPSSLPAPSRSSCDHFQAHDRNLATCRQRLEILSIDHRQASSDRREATKAKAQVECIVSDAEDAGSTSYFALNEAATDPLHPAEKGSVRVAEFAAELARVEALILEKEAELMEAAPAWEDRRDEESALREQLDAAETTLRTLAAKQGRTSQFKTQKDRDAHLRETLKSRKSLVESREKRLEDLKKDLAEAKKDLADAADRASEQRKAMVGRKEELVKLNDELVKIKEDESEKIEKRKLVVFYSPRSKVRADQSRRDLWKVDARLDSQAKNAQTELKTRERELFTMMDRVRLPLFY